METKAYGLLKSRKDVKALLACRIRDLWKVNKII
jgi:hypothetical protein